MSRADRRRRGERGRREPRIVAEEGEKVTFDCGCWFDLVETDPGERTFVYEPCRPTCPVFRYVMEVQAEQGKPMTILDAT